MRVAASAVGHGATARDQVTADAAARLATHQATPKQRAPARKPLSVCTAICCFYAVAGSILLIGLQVRR